MQELFNHYMMKKEKAANKQTKNPNPTKRVNTKPIRIQAKRLLDEGNSMKQVAEKLNQPIRNIHRWHDEGMMDNLVA